ncbi:SIR2 family protein [Acinetobacter sp. ANC 5502]
MKFGHIEIPANLINSLKENKVIIFAGAGVSMGAPANLPDFVNLTRQILNLDENEKFDSPDQKLGEGFDQGVRIHEQCIRILKKDSPQPTLLHHEILRLFPKSPRIITTNFDLLFEQAFKNNHPKEEIKKFNAPVFPLGNNIEGIIYLHGNITDPRSMVLSDADFGRAYLSESWAKRLLSDAFLNYDFIFIGYSYNDTILKYLTRALPKNRASKLYAFANIENENIQQINHWKSLGIEPLIYTKENGSHQQLPQAVEKIAQFLNLNFYEYQDLFR